MKKTNPSSSSKDSNFAHEQYLYLTTRGRKTGRAREIEIWFTYRDGHFYVIAEYPGSNWLQNLRADPQAQVRVAGQTFATHARVVTAEADPELHHAICRSIHQEIRLGRRHNCGVGSTALLTGALKGQGHPRVLAAQPRTDVA